MTTAILSWTPQSCSNSSSKMSRSWSCSLTQTRRATSCSGQCVCGFESLHYFSISSVCIFPCFVAVSLPCKLCSLTFAPAVYACTYRCISVCCGAILMYEWQVIETMQPVQTLLKASCGSPCWHKQLCSVGCDTLTNYHFFCVLIFVCNVLLSLYRRASIYSVFHRMFVLPRSLCVDALIELSDENADWKLSFDEFLNCLKPGFNPPEKSELKVTVCVLWHTVTSSCTPVDTVYGCIEMSYVRQSWHPANCGNEPQVASLFRVLWNHFNLHSHLKSIYLG